MDCNFTGSGRMARCSSCKGKAGQVAAGNGRHGRNEECLAFAAEALVSSGDQGQPTSERMEPEQTTLDREDTAGETREE